MKEGVTALFVSLVAHAVIVAYFGSLSFNRPDEPKYIVVNLTFENPQKTAETQRPAKDTGPEAAGNKRERKGNSEDNNRQKWAKQEPNTLSQTAGEEAAKQHGPYAKVADPAGQNQASAGIYQSSKGNNRDHEGASFSGSDSQTGNTSGGSSRVLDYGRGGSDETNFYFIRETVMKNIKYPERARRMGWEGIVLLSFIVLENGAVKDVKIMSGSGYRTLDDETREAVEKTTFKQKMPCRIVVHLPVEYKLK